MNANRLINMVFRMLMRQGMKRMVRGQKPDPRAKQARQAMKVMKRTRRM